MKKLSFLVPIIVIAAVSLLAYNLLAAGTINQVGFIAMTAGAMILMAFMRPKDANQTTNPKAIEEALGEFAKDVFQDDSKASAAFRSAVKDYAGNMPKAALNKILKLEGQCRDDKETYAVAMVTALCYIAGQNYEAAIKQYNRAIVIHPTSELAATIGSCQQRIGELKKARDSYEFALELDENNINARAQLATAYVASRKYQDALDNAMLALEIDEHHASSLATVAICHGVLGDNVLYKHYTDKAANEGYKVEKIKDTVAALTRK